VLLEEIGRIYFFFDSIDEAGGLEGK
jgi:hypothetical protein